MKNLLLTIDMREAFVAGRKTHTRRLDGLKEINECPGKWKIGAQIGVEGIPYWYFMPVNPDVDGILGCYKKAKLTVGEVVFVGEPWAVEKQYSHLAPRDIPRTAKIYYASDGVGEWPVHLPIGKLRSKMFMPAWAARTHARITSVGCGRLQDMGVRDIEAEGISTWEDPWKGKGLSIPQCRMRFARLWGSINPLHPYASNPYVFDYGIERVEPHGFLEDLDIPLKKRTSIVKGLLWRGRKQSSARI